MELLSFTMPTHSRARLHVAIAIGIHLRDVTVSWYDGSHARTYLFVSCARDDADRVRRIVQAAHRRVSHGSLSEPGGSVRLPGSRRANARHRR